MQAKNLGLVARGNPAESRHESSLSHRSQRAQQTFIYQMFVFPSQCELFFSLKFLKPLLLTSSVAEDDIQGGDFCCLASYFSLGLSHVYMLLNVFSARFLFFDVAHF